MMTSKRTITFDLETKNFFQDVGSNNPTALDISIACIHDSLDNSYKGFFEEELKNLWPILEQADIFVTWNGDHFDIPILNKYYPGDLGKIKSIDLMREIRNVIGRRFKLDNVARATLGSHKIANGIEAVEWWQKGELDKLKEYCIADVRITRELYDYALENKHLKYTDIGLSRTVPLDTSNWQETEPTTLTLTLPF